MGEDTLSSAQWIVKYQGTDLNFPPAELQSFELTLRHKNVLFFNALWLEGAHTRCSGLGDHFL